MINKIIGFLWGVVISALVYDYYTPEINIAWQIWAILILFIAITDMCFGIYSFITDYKSMAKTGWSTGKKVYMWASNKYKMNMPTK